MRTIYAAPVCHDTPVAGAVPLFTIAVDPSGQIVNGLQYSATSAVSTATHIAAAANAWRRRWPKRVAPNALAFPPTVTRSTALAAERHLKLVRPDRDEIADAVRELDRKLAASPVQAGTFERVDCPYMPHMTAYIYHGVAEQNVTVRLPALADDDEIQDDVWRLVAKIQRKLEERGFAT